MTTSTGCGAGLFWTVGVELQNVSDPREIMQTNHFVAVLIESGMIRSITIA